MNALECINRLVSSLDKMIVIDEIIPFLTDIQCCDADIIMAVLGIGYYASSNTTNTTNYYYKPLYRNQT